MKKKIFALCAIMLLASGCGKVPKLENGKEAIVTFKDGEKISVDDFYELIKNEYGLNSLISMVDKYICETEFEDYKDTASKNADALINSLKEQYGSEDKLLEALQGSGYNTIDAYKDYAYLSYLQSHAIEEYAKTKITDKEVENYYKNDAIGDMEINHILITSNVKKDATDDEKKAAQDEAKKKANEVIDKLNTAKKNGENITEAFTKLAKEYSEDDSNKDKGGALGKINYGSLSSKYDELVKAAKSLKDGEYSTSVITTELGYHVILKVKTYEKDTLENLKDSQKALKKCKEYAKELELDMNVVSSQFNLDRSQLLFNFTADGRVDFRELAKRLAAIYHTRIELRQIGARDKAKEIGGIGVCGGELCCLRFLKKIDTISMNMAKNQNLALNPSKINGACGRLLCCLAYEDSTYLEQAKKLPKVGDKIMTLDGEAQVVSVDIINSKGKILLNGEKVDYEFTCKE